MNVTLARVAALIERGEVVISSHGYEELAEDGILADEAIEGASSGVVVEDYPHYFKGPCVLVLQRDRDGRPIHVVWGLPAGRTSTAVLITAYRPDPRLWTDDFLRRRPER